MGVDRRIPMGYSESGMRRAEEGLARRTAEVARAQNQRSARPPRPVLEKRQIETSRQKHTGRNIAIGLIALGAFWGYGHYKYSQGWNDELKTPTGHIAAIKRTQIDHAATFDKKFGKDTELAIDSTKRTAKIKTKNFDLDMTNLACGKKGKEISFDPKIKLKTGLVNGIETGLTHQNIPLPEPAKGDMSPCAGDAIVVPQNAEEGLALYYMYQKVSGPVTDAANKLNGVNNFLG